MKKNKLYILISTIIFLISLAIVFSQCKQPEITPPTEELEVELEELPELETKSGVIDSTGGTVELSDGMRVEILQGAFAESVTVTITKKDISSIDPMQKGYYEIDTEGISPSKDIALYFPFPDDLSPEEESIVAVVYIDKDLEAREVPCTIDSGNKLALVETKHLSSWYVSCPDRINATPEEERLLLVPYYEQGATEYCWATCLTMLGKYYDNAGGWDVNEEIWDAAHYHHIGSEAGISFYAFYAGSKIKSFVKQRTGQFPERRLWVMSKQRLSPNMKNYMKQQIDQGRPIEVFLTGEEHAVLVVGYKDGGDIFVIHNPYGHPPYRERAWDDIVAKSGITQVYYTLVVPRSPGAGSQPATINIPSCVNPGKTGLTFMKKIEEGRSKGELDLRTVIRFKWDGTKPNGYVFLDRNDHQVDSVTSDYFLKIYDLEVANTGEQTLDAAIECTIRDAETATEVYSGLTNVTVPPSATETVDLGPVSLDFSSALGTAGPETLNEPREYTLTLALFDRATPLRSYDEISPIFFKVEPVEELEEPEKMIYFFTREDCRRIFSPEYIFDITYIYWEGRPPAISVIYCFNEGFNHVFDVRIYWYLPYATDEGSRTKMWQYWGEDFREEYERLAESKYVCAPQVTFKESADRISYIRRNRSSSDSGRDYPVCHTTELRCHTVVKYKNCLIVLEERGQLHCVLDSIEAKVKKRIDEKLAEMSQK